MSKHPTTTEEGIQKAMAENGWTYKYAKEYLQCMNGTSAVYESIRQIMREQNLSYGAAKYALYKMKKGLPYSKHQTHFDEVKYDDVKNIDIPSNIKRFKKKTHYQGLYIYEAGGKQISLATVVYLQYHKCDKPKGYIINHIDGNPLNNSIDNLEMIPGHENVHRSKKK